MNFKRLQANWNEYGERDPLWSILTTPGKEGGAWNLEEFLETGRQEIARVLAYVDGLHTVPRRRALDFGCGVGRLTQALAEHFDEVAGVDIAPSMVELARRYNRHGARCAYHLNPRRDLRLFAGDRFDFIYSNLTLQHMEPRYSKRYLRELVRVLAPGGVLLFQLPGETLARRNGLVRRVAPWAWHLYHYYYFKWQFPGQPLMELNGVRRPVVERLLASAGARVLDVTPDGSAAPEWTGFRYCATK